MPEMTDLISELPPPRVPRGTRGGDDAKPRSQTIWTMVLAPIGVFLTLLDVAAAIALLAVLPAALGPRGVITTTAEKETA
jgi:hypothetical protein